MEAGNARRAAAAAFFLATAWVPLVAQSLESATGEASGGPVAVKSAPAVFVPKAERLEILKDWEKKRYPKGPPEIVAGIYERDYIRYDFHNEVAITIDDTSPNKYMAMELDLLKKYRIKAVFFIIGSYFVGKTGRPLPRAKELLDRVVAEGHEIGSHTYLHSRLDEGAFFDNRRAIDAELDRNQAVIDKILGYHYPILYFRPPNGAHSTPLYTVDRALRAKGEYLANWTITAFDWNMRYKKGNPERLTAEQVIARTVKQAREESGGVVLFHGFSASAEIFDRLLGALAAARNERGSLSFSTLDELMRLKYLAPAR